MAESCEEPRKGRVKIVVSAVAALLLIATSAYVAAYLFAGEVQYGHRTAIMAGYYTSMTITAPGHIVPRPNAVIRRFLRPLRSDIFVPLAWLESRIMRRHVSLADGHGTAGSVIAHEIEP